MAGLNKSVEARFAAGSRFIRRPAAQEKESFPSALIRLACSNALDGINDLAGVLGLTGVQLLSAPATLAWTALREGKSFEAQTGLGTAGALRFRYSRVCFECLNADEEPYIRAEWDLPLSLICGVHGTLLLDTCEWCGGKIDYFRSDIAVCLCGKSFEREPVVAPTWIMPMVDLFLDDGDRSHPGQFAEASANEVRAARALERLAEHEMQQSTLFSSGKRVDAPMLRQSHLEGLKPWFERGAISFIEKMRALGGEEDSWKQARFSLKLYLFPKVSAILKSARMTRSMHERRLARSDLAGEDLDFYRLYNLADEFHVTLETVKRWMNSGLLPGVIVEKGKQSRVPASSYLQLKKLFDSSVCTKDVTKVLGCSEAEVKKLVGSGILQRLFLSLSFWSDRISLESLTAWRVRLSEVAAGCAGSRADIDGAPGSVVADSASQSRAGEEGSVRPGGPRGIQLRAGAHRSGEAKSK